MATYTGREQSLNPLLIEYERGVLRVEGVSCTLFENQNIIITPQNSFEYQVVDDRQGAHDFRQSIEINPPDTEIIVTTSWFGEYPLFYYLNERRLIISSSILHLCERMRALKIAIELDDTAFHETLIFDYPLRERTLFTGVHKTMQGKRYRFRMTAGTREIDTLFVLPFDRGECKQDEGKVLSQAKDILLSLLPRNSIAKSSPVLLPLSGGLDSRLLACLLKAADIDCKAVVFGPSESMERFVAQKVADSLGIRVDVLDLGDEFYKNYGTEVTLLTCGLSGHHHCHLYACLKANQVKAGTIVHGFLGGEFAGASQPVHAQQYGMSKEEAFERFLAEHVRGKYAWGIISSDHQWQIVNDLKKIIEECCSENLPCHFDEYVHNVDRQFSLIANIFSVSETFGCFVRPFANKDYAIFFNKLPFRFRMDRLIFKKACYELFPNEFRIGSQSQIFAKNSTRGKVEKIISSFISKASFASFIISQGRFCLPNPKAFERHRKVLYGVLRKDFFSAIDMMGKKTGMNLKPLQSINLRNRTELTAQYRVLSARLLV